MYSRPAMGRMRRGARKVGRAIRRTSRFGRGASRRRRQVLHTRRGPRAGFSRLHRNGAVGGSTWGGNIMHFDRNSRNGNRAVHSDQRGNNMKYGKEATHSDDWGKKTRW